MSKNLRLTVDEEDTDQWHGYLAGTEVKKFDPDQPQDEGGRWSESGGGGGSKELPSKPWHDPPAPQGTRAGGAGGFTATGETNTSVGDLGESLLQKQLGMESLLPEGRRQNPLDVRFDASKMAFEVKTVTTSAKEYKIKMKASEVRSKEAYARKNGFEPGMIMLVMDVPSGTAHAYSRKGIGNYRLSQKGWSYMGKVSV